VDGNEQCSLNVKNVLNPKRTKCNSIAKVEMGRHIHLRYGFFLSNSECSRYIPEMQEQSSHEISFYLTSVMIVEVSNNEKFNFLTSNLCFLHFLMGVPWQTRKSIRGSTMTNRLKSTADLSAMTGETNTSDSKQEHRWMQSRNKGWGARDNFCCRAPMTYFMTSSFAKITFSLIPNVVVCFFPVVKNVLTQLHIQLAVRVFEYKHWVHSY